jgi:hypothetical protein
VLLRLRFLTSFGEFNPRYPTEGELPFQKLKKKRVGIFVPHHVRRDSRAQRGEVHVVWQSHKGQWREQHWPAASHRIKRRGNTVYVQADHRLPVHMKINLMLEVLGWDHKADEVISATMALYEESP